MFYTGQIPFQFERVSDLKITARLIFLALFALPCNPFFAKVHTAGKFCDPGRRKQVCCRPKRAETAF